MIELNWTDKDLGAIDAYAFAVENGYFSGTREQWYAMISGTTQNASDAEAYAKGTRAGEAVDSDDPAYHNNSSYWNDQAGDNAENAEAFANGTRGGVPVTSGDIAYENNAPYHVGQAEDEAENAEAWANGTRGGVDVTSGDPAYEKNSKYWEGQAALQKAAAQAAAETASASYNVNLLAPNYDATSTYAVGAHVIYSGGYYECISAITTAEAWTAAHWRQLTVGGEAGDLKSALSNVCDASLYNKIVFTADKCIDLTASYIDLYTPTSNGLYEYAIVPCKENDVFIVTILGGGSYRAWAFLKADRTVISGAIADAYADVSDYKLVAPTDAAYLVINNRYTVNGHSKSYKQNTDAPEELFDMANATSKASGYLTKISANKTNANYVMGFAGGAEEKNGYTFDRYAVQAGDIIYIHVNQCDAYVLWRFSSNDSGSVGNLIGELQHESYKGLIEVPEGATYIFISRLTSDTETGVYYPSKQAGIVRGPVFMFVTDNKLNIICGDTAWGFIGKKYMSLASWSTQLTATTACAIVMTPSGFKTVSFMTNEYQVNLKVTDIIVAYVWGGKVFSFGQPVIICNDPPLLAKWYQRENVPVYVNNKKINNYSIALRPSNYARDYGYFYKFTNAYLTSGERWTYCFGDDLTQDFSNNGLFVQNTASIANKKILCIGDSFTARGWYQHQIKSHEASVQFVGTRQTNYHEYMSEGYSGASANQIFGHYYKDLSDGQTKTSPFWNPSTEKPDFAYYCSQNNISPDYVVIMFGLNETNDLNYYNPVQDMVTQIADYNTANNTNIIAYVVEPMVQANLPADEHTPSNKGYTCGKYWYILEDCVKIPGRTILVDEYDYNSGTVEYGYGLNAHDGVSDAIHPSESVGFKKIGDQIYNWLGVSSNT